MRVYNPERKWIGNCQVNPDTVIGKFYNVPIAIQGPYCKACKVNHTQFEIVGYGVDVMDGGELVLIAEDRNHARFLPGFSRKITVIKTLE